MYYQLMDNDKELYDTMNNNYDIYITYDLLEYCRHSVDTQMNEATHNSVAKYVDLSIQDFLAEDFWS